jgi:outer membrane protein OmpA-like peptidoglycan-associated protein
MTLMQTIKNILIVFLLPLTIFGQTNEPKMVVDKKFPLILFDNNSITPSTKKPLYETENVNFKVAVQNIFKILTDNPTMKIEINGYADIKESNPDTLSKKRAELVFKELVKLGVDKSRLTTVGHGKSQPQRTEEMIKAEKTKADKEALRLYNRRVTYRVLNF